MKQIIFPTDFSANSDHALKYAINLCRLLNAELVLFHSCRIPALAYQEEIVLPHENVVLDEAKEELEAYLKKNSHSIADIKVKTKVEYGLTAESISAYAKKTNADLIIMGTKGAKGLEGALIGSTTSAVIELSDCPVMAIPEKSKFKKVEKIVFATDFRDNDVESIKFLSGIASLFNAEIIILHVADFLVPVSYEKALLTVFEEEIRKKVFYKNLSFKIIKGMGAAKTINEFVENNNADIVALSTRKRNIFEKLFEKSLTKKLAIHSNIPVLAFHI